jgi:hypothetical protein
MSILNTRKFDILRGYPNGSGLVWPFQIKKEGSPLAEKSIPQGSIVTQELQSGETVVDLATSANLAAADPVDMYLVVEGNDDYSGEFVGKCNTVRLGTGIIWEADDYAAGSYTPGTPVMATGGQVQVKTGTQQIIGYVLEDRTASKGTVVIAS